MAFGKKKEVFVSINEKSKAKPCFCVAGLLQKSNIYKSFRAIVDCYEFIKSRHPELFDDGG